MGWFQKAMKENTSKGSMTSAMGAIDDVFNPAAARAREQLEAQHEAVQPMPSPGDDVLKHGRITLKRPKAQ
ncbi:MAG: hypothetical protein ACYC3W_04740 [Candidatus Nanopelagicales bacterium]